MRSNLSRNVLCARKIAFLCLKSDHILTCFILDKSVTMKFDCCLSVCTDDRWLDLQNIWVIEAIRDLTVGVGDSVDTNVDIESLWRWISWNLALDVASVLFTVNKDLVAFVVGKSHLDSGAVTVWTLKVFT